MRVKVVEISGYVPAFISLFMTNRNLTDQKLADITEIVDYSTDSRGFFVPTSPYATEFLDLLNKTITYGIKSEHHQILKFIDISIYMEGLHRGAQDDYDAHAARLNIIRSTTRTKKGADHPEFSDYYKDKIVTFEEGFKMLFGEDMPLMIKDPQGINYKKTPWGYIKEGFENDADVRRGLTPLGMSSNNISKVAYGEHLQHIYDLRREEATGKKANPELRHAMEMMRKDLSRRCPPLGEYLGKIWVTSGGGHYEEKILTTRISKRDIE
jgi:hypothetical protein